MVIVELTDHSGKVECALFGDYVDELNKKMGKCISGLPIVVVQFAKVKIFRVPTFLYGAADEEGMKLDSIRRTFSYLKPNSNENQWNGVRKSDTSPLKPYILCAVRRIAKLISGRGGGLASVQAIAITHGEGIIEVACNLLDPKNVVGERVQQEIENLAREEGISVEKGYYPDFSHEEIVIMQNEMSYHQ
ncbi:hypothetical protein P8452_07284 [Trifolium repens]|nr:hypothetical protein P8452_07284 [Trifolium repens]